MTLCDTQSDDTVRVKVIGTLESIAQRLDAIDTNRVRSAFPDPLEPISSYCCRS